ncbi:hypothetical protein [Saccharothrix sp. ALI-22-I]|nr:hypothetical protein [Saccharothrix sp. ALI-22-I]
MRSLGTLAMAVPVSGTNACTLVVRSTGMCMTPKSTRPPTTL